MPHKPLAPRHAFIIAVSQAAREAQTNRLSFIPDYVGRRQDRIQVQPEVTVVIMLFELTGVYRIILLWILNVTMVTAVSQEPLHGQSILETGDVVSAFVLEQDAQALFQALHGPAGDPAGDQT